MRERGLIALGWVAALALAAALLALAACGGPSPSGSPPATTGTSAGPSADASASASATAPPAPSATPTPSESPPITTGAGELRDASGVVVARPTGSEEISAVNFGALVAGDPAWASQLEGARALGFTNIGTVTVTHYDDGTAVTSAVLANGNLDHAILVHAAGTKAGDFLVRPLLAGETVSALEISSADGTVTLDLAKGEISSVDTHHSCSYGNCLAGALYFWIDQNGFWDEVGDWCKACFTGEPAEQEVLCPMCLASIPVATIASAVECGIAPCSLCYSDACGGGSGEVIERWCSAEMGAPQVYERVRSHRCQNARTADSECVEQVDLRSVEVCPNGCAGNNCAPVICTSDVNCPHDAQDLGYVCVQGIPDVNPNIGQLYRYTERSWCDTSLCDTIAGPCTSLCARTCVATLIDVCAEGCWDSPPGSTGTAVADVAPACDAAALPPGTGRCFSAAECRTRDEDIWVRVLLPPRECGAAPPPCYVIRPAPRECFTDPATGSLSSGRPYRHYYPVRLPNGSQTCTWEIRHRDVAACTASCFAGTCDTTCDPNRCSGEVRSGDQQGDQRCVGGRLSAQYQRKSCATVSGGGAYCATGTYRHDFATCPNGCKPNKIPNQPDRFCNGGYCPLGCVRDEVLATTCREENGTANLVHQVRQYYCDATVASGQACRSQEVERTAAVCPGACLDDGTDCAPTCDPDTCTGDALSGYPSCAYNYTQYVLEQSVDSKSCQPQRGGGETCVTTSQTRLRDTCPYGCNADRTDCAAPSAVPRAPGEFLMYGAPGTLTFTWKDNSDNEQGFRVYHGARFAIPPRPSYLIQTVAANTTEVVVNYTRTGDVCFEVYAYNAAGESAPAYYCTGF